MTTPTVQDYPLPEPYDDNTPQDHADALRDHADWPYREGSVLDIAAMAAADLIEKQAAEIERLLRTTPTNLVADFHRHVGAAIRTTPTVGVPGAEMRVRFIEEEARELRDAVESSDVVAVADALADLAYVVYGAALHFGIPLADVLAEVHQSNMTKDPAGDGKAVKGVGYMPPRIAEVLARNYQAVGTRPAPCTRPQVRMTHEVVMAFIEAPDHPDDDITGPLAAAFRAAGIDVVTDQS